MILKCILFLLFLEATKAATLDSTINILNFWNKQDKQFQVSDEEKLVLIIGLTGSGKSALTLLLNDKNVIAVENFPGSGYFLIEDENKKISTTTSISHTIIPELVKDSESNVAYYDCSGFEDTRPDYEIGTAYLINKLLKNAKSFKILLVVENSALKLGVNQPGFPDLVRYVITLLKDVDKYKDAIAMVATKVDNIYDGDNLEKDEDVIQQIAIYLENEKTLLAQENRDSELSRENPRYNDERMKLLDVLLQRSRHSSNGYERIGIFRVPDGGGSLYDMEHIKKNKHDIKKMINESLKFIKNDGSEFGYVLSSKAITEFDGLLHRILTDQLDKDISDACDHMKIHYKLVLSKISEYGKLNEVYEKIKKNLDSVSYTEPLPFTKDLIRVAETIALKVSIEKLQKNIDFINFLMNIHKKTLFMPDTFHRYIDSVKQFVSSQYQTRVQFLVTQLLEFQLPGTIRQAFDEIQQFYSKMEENTHDLDDLQEKISEAHQTLVKVNINDPQTFVNAIQKLGIVLSEENSTKMKKVIENFSLFNNIEIKYQNNMDTSRGIFEKVTHQLKYAKSWYELLIEVYSDLCSFHCEKPEEEHAIVKSLLQKAQSATKVGNIGLEKLKECTKKEYSILRELGNMKLDSQKLKALKKILSDYLETPTIECSEDELEMIVRGNIIKISSIVTNQSCWQTSKYVEIFARDSVVIDSDVSKSGAEVEIAIMSPVWSIIGEKTIRLHGDDGKSKGKAKDGEVKNESPGRGEDGEAGNPGGPGGNFLGIGKVFVNGQGLTIQTNGGNGGPGQNGGHGSIGVTGRGKLLFEGAKELLNICMYYAFRNQFSNKECYDLFLEKLGFSTSFMSNLLKKDESFSFHYGPGIDGGDGGNGGKGGFGGQPGHIKVMAVDLFSHIKEERNYGDFGSYGTKGLGGKAAVGTVVEITVHYISGGKRSIIEKTSVDPLNPIKKGKDGQDNICHKNRSVSVPADYYYDPSITINKFKYYITTKSVNYTRESKLEEFLFLLNNILVEGIFFK